MTDNIMLAPPLAFLIVLASMLLLLRLLKGLSFKCKPNDEACTKSYACGEDVPTSMIQPDYSAFFPFAFLFTILHVVALVVATAPINSAASLAMALIYVAGGITGLVILFRRNK
jgi:NADH-quinone oxidoreductase subunit A